MKTKIEEEDLKREIETIEKEIKRDTKVITGEITKATHPNLLNQDQVTDRSKN